jgi:hypothetical protein
MLFQSNLSETHHNIARALKGPHNALGGGHSGIARGFGQKD